MPDSVSKRYWDSSAFLALIKYEPGRADVCERIVDDAKAGRSQIFTSTIALTEVVKRRRGPVEGDKKTEEILTAFFKNKFITLVPVDISIATRARRLIWDFTWLTARDAIHIATALELKVDALEHYDDDDMGKVAKRIADESLPGFPEIRHPKWVGQLDLVEGAQQPASPEAGASAPGATEAADPSPPGSRAPPLPPTQSGNASATSKSSPHQIMTVPSSARATGPRGDACCGISPGGNTVAGGAKCGVANPSARPRHLATCTSVSPARL
jgi:predicted nucleic acid-binding protein